MTLFVLDTHPLVFYAADKLNKLGRAARRIFEKFESGEVALFIPAPVAIEMWLLTKNGTLQLETSFRKWWSRLTGHGFLQAELTWQDVITAADLPWDHRDIFDRLIAATTLRLDCPLVTKDSEMASWAGIEVVW